MPPKKKKQTKTKQETSNNEPPKDKKDIVVEPKKVQQSKPNPNLPPKAKTQSKEEKINNQASNKIVNPLDDHHHELGKKISLDENKKLTQAQILEKRRLRFKLGTELDPEEAEKVKKQRLEKFGGEQPVSRQAIQKRKQKFGLKPVALDEDKQTIEKRRQKFGGGGEKQDPETISKRKQKFGGNDISLDDEIMKSKDQNRFKRSQPKHGFKHASHHKKFKRY